MRTQHLVAAALLCAPQLARAQSAEEPLRRSLSISGGVVRENRRDDADSPLAYAGSGPGARIVYDWARGARSGFVAIAGGGSTLTAPGVPSLDFQEEFSSYSLGAGMRWRVGRASRTAGELALGAELNTTLTLVRHLYAGSDVSQQNFDLGVASIGPDARWTRRLGAAELSASIAVPLLAWVDHPYADVRYARQLTKIRLVPLSQFHEADGAIGCTFRTGSAVDVDVSYHVALFELDDVEPVRRVSQALSLGFVRRIGARP